MAPEVLEEGTVTRTYFLGSVRHEIYWLKSLPRHGDCLCRFLGSWQNPLYFLEYWGDHHRTPHGAKYIQRTDEYLFDAASEAATPLRTASQRP